MIKYSRQKPLTLRSVSWTIYWPNDAIDSLPAKRVSPYNAPDPLWEKPTTWFVNQYGEKGKNYDRHTQNTWDMAGIQIIKPNNPVDLVGDAGFFRYEASTRILLEDPNIDGIIVASVHGGYARPEEFTGAILKMIRERKLHEEYKKPILATWVGGREYEDLVLDLKAAGVPIYSSSWRTARSMLALYLEGQRLKKERKIK